MTSWTDGQTEFSFRNLFVHYDRSQKGNTFNMKRMKQNSDWTVSTQTTVRRSATDLSSLVLKKILSMNICICERSWQGQ